jgi:hypothetical protein
VKYIPKENMPWHAEKNCQYGIEEIERKQSFVRFVEVRLSAKSNEDLDDTGFFNDNNISKMNTYRYLSLALSNASFFGYTMHKNQSNQAFSHSNPLCAAYISRVATDIPLVIAGTSTRLARSTERNCFLACCSLKQRDL